MDRIRGAGKDTVVSFVSVSNVNVDEGGAGGGGGEAEGKGRKPFIGARFESRQFCKCCRLLSFKQVPELYWGSADCGVSSVTRVSGHLSAIRKTHCCATHAGLQSHHV